MLQNLADKILKDKISISSWMWGFLSILFVRFLLESLSSPTFGGVGYYDSITLVHHGLFFLATGLGLILIVTLFNKNIIENTKLFLFTLPTIWIAPVVDIVLSRGNGYIMSYIFDIKQKLLFDLLFFLSPKFMHGATYGMRTGIVIIILGIGCFVYTKTHSFFKSFLSILVSYLFIFFIGSLPSIIYLLTNSNASQNTNPNEIVYYLQKLIYKSNIYHNTTQLSPNQIEPLRFLELSFDKLMSQILFLISFIFSFIIFKKIDKEKVTEIIRNSRIERVLFYLTTLMCGMGFAYIKNLSTGLVWIDVFGFVCLLISWFCLWMYAVHKNDIADIEIDKISNKNRPLVTKTIDTEIMSDSANFWLVAALLGSFCAGYYPFFMSLVYIFCSYIYSTPPLRLRRFPIIPSFLIGIASLTTVLAGFFFVSIDKKIETFPVFLSIGIVIIVTLAINFKDIKDIEGDKANGIITLPILFKKNGIKVVALCMSLSILLIPLFLSFKILNFVTIPSAIIAYKIIIKKEYTEGPIFILRFIILFCIALCYIFFT